MNVTVKSGLETHELLEHKTWKTDNLTMNKERHRTQIERERLDGQRKHKWIHMIDKEEKMRTGQGDETQRYNWDIQKRERPKHRGHKRLTLRQHIINYIMGRHGKNLNRKKN